MAEDLEGVSAIAARGNLVAAAMSALEEIWLIKIGVRNFVSNLRCPKILFLKV